MKDIAIQQVDWDAHVTHPMQSYAWGEFRASMGIDVVRFVSDDNQYCQLTFHPIPHTPYTVGYFPKGPAPTQPMIDDLRRIGKEKNAIYIQIEPNQIKNYELPITNYKLRVAHRPMFTKYNFLYDLTPSIETLLSTMHTKTRYNIKVAQKHEVIITEDTSDGAFSTYLQLSKETTQRQGFFAHNTHYHTQMWKYMKQSGMATLWQATYQGETLASWIIFRWNNTIYYPYGASSRDHREVMAPTLLLWDIAQWGKREGCTSFDLWGALGPTPDTKDPWYGFHRFKEGFHPALVEYVGSYDLVIHPFLYELYKVADMVRWGILKLKIKV